MRNSVTKLHTDVALLRALEAASQQKPTEDELRQQRVSFIMGTLKEASGVTRSMVQNVLAEQEGRKHA